MTEILLVTNIKREPKTLYFCGTSPEGFITVSKATGKPGRRFKDPTKNAPANPINGADSL